MAEYQTLLVDKNDGVTTITLNRPEKRNAMSPQLHRDMYDLLTDLRYDKDTRVIVITGAGESFCAGQDLKQYFIENLVLSVKILFKYTDQICFQS